MIFCWAIECFRISSLAYSPLAMGILCGKYFLPDVGPADARLNLFWGQFSNCWSDRLICMNFLHSWWSCLNCTVMFFFAGKYSEGESSQIQPVVQSHLESSGHGTDILLFTFIGQLKDYWMKGFVKLWIQFK